MGIRRSLRRALRSSCSAFSFAFSSLIFTSSGSFASHIETCIFASGFLPAKIFFRALSSFVAIITSPVN